MLAPNQSHFMAADARHAELQAAAAHRRLEALLHPEDAPVNVTVNRRRVAAATASVLLALLIATGVAGAVRDPQPAAPAGNASSVGSGGGGASLVK